MNIDKLCLANPNFAQGCKKKTRVKPTFEKLKTYGPAVCFSHDLSVLCDPKKGAQRGKKAAMAFEEEKPKVGRWYFGRLLSHTEKPMHAKKESNFVVFYIFSVKLRAV